MKERWLAIPNHPKYEVSNTGRVRSRVRRYKGSPHIMAQTLDKSGYPSVVLQSLVHKYGTCRRTVHSLVLSAFLGLRPDGMQASHLDGDKCNNIPSNLVWETPAENSMRKFDHGTVHRGVQIMQAKLDPDKVKRIRAFALQGAEYRDLMKKFNVSKTTICNVVLRNTWCHVA